MTNFMLFYIFFMTIKLKIRLDNYVILFIKFNIKFYFYAAEELKILSSRLHEEYFSDYSVIDT